MATEPQTVVIDDIRPFAIVGVFDTPAQLFHACEELRDAGYQHFDAHTPFPVHGLERAMGLAPSRLPWIVLLGGFTGLFSMIALAWYTQGYDYPLNISGKEPFSYQAFVPLFFELTVLFSALACFFGMWGMNRLPTYFHPVMQHPMFPRATDDKFLLSVESRDPKFDLAQTRELLEKVGAQDVAEVMP
jgi:hypothetical protein